MAALRHRDANQAFEALEAHCRAQTTACIRLPEGPYRVPETEARYQTARHLDRQAQLWLIGGQASLILTGGMFLLDLIYRDDDPPNIPYSPFMVFVAGRKLGLAIRF